MGKDNMQSKTMQNSNKSRFKLKLVGATCALLLGTSSVYAVPAVQGGGCGLTTVDTSTSELLLPDSILGGTNSASPPAANGAGLIPGSNNPNLNLGEDVRACFFTLLPTLADMDTTCNVVPTETDLQTNYLALLHTNALPSPTFCLYQYDIDLAAVDVRTNAAVVTLGSTAVPIFTPLGILAMMSGLLWFGKRRRKFK